MAKSHSENVAINTGVGIALKLVTQGMALILKTVFIYTLGDQYNGVSTLFTDILHMLSLAELGVGSAITFALYRPIKEGDARKIAALMNFYRRAYRIIAGFILVAGAACLPFLPYMVKGVPDIKESLSLIFMLYIVNSASSYLMIYKSTLLTASERGYVISRTSIWFTLGRTVVECVLLLVFKNFILYLVVGVVESLLRNFVISRRATAHFPDLKQYADEKLTREETGRLLGDVGALTLYKVCQVILSSTDSIVISWMLPAGVGVVAVGYLGNYRLLFNTVQRLTLQFFTSFRPSLGTMATDAGAERQHRVFKTTNFITFWCMCFCCTSLFTLSGPFVRDIWLRKPGAVLSFPVLLAMTLNFYITAMTQPTNAFRDGNGLFVQGKYRPLAMAALNIMMDVALVGPLGVFGVLLATSIARLATQAWYDPWLIYRRVFRLPVKPYFVVMLKYTIVVAASCALTYYLAYLAEGWVPNVYAAFLVRMALCAAIPNALVVALYHKTEEYRDFVARLGRLSGKLKKVLLRRRKR